jgi:hypothetical protein
VATTGELDSGDPRDFGGRQRDHFGLANQTQTAGKWLSDTGSHCNARARPGAGQRSRLGSAGRTARRAAIGRIAEAFEKTLKREIRLMAPRRERSPQVVETWLALRQVWLSAEAVFRCRWAF